MLIFLRSLIALGCWLMGTCFGFLLTLALAGWPDGGSYGPGPFFILPLAAIYGLPVWAVTFLPLFFALKDNSLLWKPYLAAPLGVTAGFLGFEALLGGRLSNLTHGPFDERVIAWMPLFIGMFTFLLGAILSSIISIVLPCWLGRRLRELERILKTIEDRTRRCS